MSSRVAIGVLSRQRMNIFIFHRVMAEPDPLRPGEPDVPVFEAMMRCLRETWNPLPLDEAVERMFKGSLPPRAAVVTFDDGYADNIELAGPVLKRLGIPATVFLSSAFLNGGRMWNDTVIEVVRRLPEGVLDLDAIGLGRYPICDDGQRRAAADAIIGAIKYRSADERRRVTDHLEERVDALPDDLMLDEAALARGADLGIRFGAHTQSHPILARLDDDQAWREIAEGKAEVEAIIGESADLFAYPNGKLGEDYTERDVELVRRAGFKAAVATNWGVASADDDPLQLPRFTPWRKDCAGFRLLMLRHYWQHRRRH